MVKECTGSIYDAEYLPNGPDWSKIPEGFDYFAINDEGVGLAFKVEPVLSEEKGGFYLYDETWECLIEGPDPNCMGVISSHYTGGYDHTNWEKSLQKRTN